MYKALIKSIDPNIEEEVTVCVNGLELLGFVGYSPFVIEVGETYEVSIEVTILDEFNIREIEQHEKGFQRIGMGFAYLIRGVLLPGGIVDAGIELRDELFVDLTYLYNKYVEFRVDRLNLSFAKE